MATSWYSIVISPQSGGGAIFNGYFNVDDTTSLIQGFYDLSLPTSSGYTDVLLPTNDVASYSRANNIYPFTYDGMNFYSTALQTFFSIGQNHFNIFYSSGGIILILYTLATSNLTSPPYTITTTPISGPPSNPITCFKEGSKILTDQGYKLIQDLRKGDFVKTLLHNYLPIDLIGKREIYHPASKERIKDQLYQCSQEEYEEVFEPLIITGCHSILVDDFISEEQREKVIEVNGNTYVTDRKYRLPACADLRTSIYEIPGNYTIYHLALENDDYYMNYGIYANGLLVETCSKRYLKELSNMVLIE
jgi:hypothetical protein